MAPTVGQKGSCTLVLTDTDGEYSISCLQARCCRIMIEKLSSLVLPFGQAPVVWTTTNGLDDPIVIAHFFAYDWPDRENWWIYELCNDPKPPGERYN